MGMLAKMNRSWKKNQQEADKQLQADAKGFIKEVGGLMSKYQVKAEPVLQITETGIIPGMKIMRLEEEKKEEIKISG